MPLFLAPVLIHSGGRTIGESTPAGPGPTSAADYTVLTWDGAPGCALVAALVPPVETPPGWLPVSLTQLEPVKTGGRESVYVAPRDVVLPENTLAWRTPDLTLVFGVTAPDPGWKLPRILPAGAAVAEEAVPVKPKTRRDASGKFARKRA